MSPLERLVTPEDMEYIGFIVKSYAFTRSLWANVDRDIRPAQLSALESNVDCVAVDLLDCVHGRRLHASVHLRRDLREVIQYEKFVRGPIRL